MILAFTYSYGDPDSYLEVLDTDNPVQALKDCFQGHLDDYNLDCGFEDPDYVNEVFKADNLDAFIEELQVILNMYIQDYLLLEGKLT